MCNGDQLCWGRGMHRERRNTDQRVQSCIWTVHKEFTLMHSHRTMPLTMNNAVHLKIVESFKYHHKKVCVVVNLLLAWFILQGKSVSHHNIACNS